MVMETLLKIKIISDSGCDIKADKISDEACSFEKVPLNLHFEDRVYVDDEHLDMDEFISHMEASPTTVKSASPSPESFLEKFVGPENVFVVTLSSKISATYQSALSAKKMYLEQYSKKFIHVFDSLSASIGEGLVALKIAECARSGLSNIEIVEHVNKFISGMKTYFLIDKFDTLVKSGRINPYIAKVASMLNIKPICGADEHGEIKMYDKARGYNKAVKRLIELIKESAPNLEGRVVGIAHTRCYEKAVAFKEELLKTLRVKAVFIEESSGLIASYANRGGFVVAL